MEHLVKYCPLTGICPHEPVAVIPRSYFLIQPFDEEKELREEAIKYALKKFYGRSVKYELKKSDSLIYNVSIYCDICKKIKSSQFCIVDISGEFYEIIKKDNNETVKKIFIRPNVALELGLAYGFNKPAIILSRLVDGKRIIPSDIQFIRYIDISTVEFRGWSAASQGLLDWLKKGIPFSPLKKALEWDKTRGIIKDHYKPILYLKKKLHILQDKKYQIHQILYTGRNLIGLIKDAEELVEGICFKFYKVEYGLEQEVGIAKVSYVQTDGFAQTEFCNTGGDDSYWDNILWHCKKGNEFIPGRHRLELMIPKEFSKFDINILRQILELY